MNNELGTCWIFF